jgi:hypothetical protein
LNTAIVMLEYTMSCNEFYELFLSVFPPQRNDPHRPVIQSFHLQCYPRLIRLNDTSLVYSSPPTEGRKPTKLHELTLYRFHGLFNDHRRPYSFNNSKNVFLNFDKFINYFPNKKIFLYNLYYRFCHLLTSDFVFLI